VAEGDNDIKAIRFAAGALLACLGSCLIYAIPVAAQQSTPQPNIIYMLTISVGRMLDFTAPGHEGELPPRLLERRAAADRLPHHSGRQRGHRTKKTLEIDPFQAETVRLIFRLAWEGDVTSGPMGVKSITNHLNAAGIRTRDGGRWGIDAVHKVLTRTTYIGRHRFNTKFWKTRERKPETEVAEIAHWFSTSHGGTWRPRE
jgi:hypothetical protein